MHRFFDWLFGVPAHIHAGETGEKIIWTYQDESQPLEALSLAEQKDEEA